MSNVQQPAEIFPSGDIDNSFAILCGSSGVADALSLLLAQEGYKHDTNSDLVIVLDIPRGFAPVYYEKTKNYLHKIVVTWSLCPEYLDDLWDLKPNILISGDSILLNLTNTINWVRQKNQLRITRSTSSELSPNERRVLRLVAYNYSNKDISEKLNIEYQTVKNTLSVIYQKIGGVTMRRLVTIVIAVASLLFAFLLTPLSTLAQAQQTAFICPSSTDEKNNSSR